MQLIVTRPEPSASVTAGKLRAMGHNVCVSPVLEIQSTGEAMPLGNFTCLIATSTNALKVLEQQGIDEELLQIPLFVVGDHTAINARQIGFEKVFSASGNAQNLIELLENAIKNSDIATGMTLYICGADITDKFTDALQKSGLQYQRWANYKANLVDQLTDKTVELLCSGIPVGVLLYSARSAHQFIDCMDAFNTSQTFENITFFTISQKVANALGADAIKKCEVAEKPDEVSLFELIPAGK